MKEARFWVREGDVVRCSLCPHACSIGEGKRGLCGVRENRGGRLFSLIYGMVSSMHVDPIEKKPLFHFKPGEMAFSLGSIGCNLKCLHCQNYMISQAKYEEFHLYRLSPEEVCDLCEKEGCRIIAWTYNEPTIWHEFTYDASREASRRGLHTVYVTNGFIQEDPLREISPFLDAMNIDIKAFSDEFYRKICKGRLDPVLNTAELAFSLGIHVELTYLIIPGMNDSIKEFTEFSRWVINSLSSQVPVHFTRFHPDYRMTDVPPTPVETLETAYRVAKEEGLEFVYLGNVWMPERENTYCPRCGNLVIERSGFRSLMRGVKEGKCSYCGADLNII